MSVLIEGMEMPKCCDACSFACWSNLHQTGSCDLLNSKQCFDDYSTDYRTKRSEHCPLIEIPEPHGRLIDADAVTLEDGPYEYDDWCKWALEQYQDAPTVIPASEEEVDEAQRDYERAVEDQRYCEMYEPTYDPETGAM